MEDKVLPMKKLVLDPMCVLSAWEQMGGNAFSCDGAHLHHLDTVTLDLSSWEARLKPLSAVSTSQMDTIFGTLFNPFPFLTSFCLQPAGSTFFPEGPQVVPLCPSISAGSMDQLPNNHSVCSAQECPALDDTTQGSHIDDDVHISINLSDTEPARAASPTSSEPGIVPDFDTVAIPHMPPAVLSSGSTATSGGLPLQGHNPGAEPPGAASISCLPHLAPFPTHMAVPGAGLLSSASFVPVSQPHAGPGPSAAATIPSCGLGSVACCKQEPVGLSGTEVYQQSFAGASSAAVLPLQQQQQQQQPHSYLGAAAMGRQGVVQQAQQLSTRAPSSSAAVTTTTSTVVPAQQQSQQQSGSSSHVRTRAECLERYREKKARRLYTKKIRYQLRKINADKRPRIKGRFVKKEDLAEFLAAQRGSGGVAVRGRPEDSYFGDVGDMDTDDE